MFISLCMAMGNRYGNSRRRESADRGMMTMPLKVAVISEDVEADPYSEAASRKDLSEPAPSGARDAAADGLPDLLSSIIANTEVLEKVYGENHNLNNIRHAADKAKRRLLDVNADEDRGEGHRHCF